MTREGAENYLRGLEQELSYYETRGEEERAALVRAEIKRVRRALDPEATTVRAPETTVMGKPRRRGRVSDGPTPP